MLVFPMTFGRQLLFALGVAGPLLTMAQPCEDRNAQCGYWAAIGECQANPSYMLVMCQHSCHSCDKEGAVQERIYQHLEKKIVTGLSDVDRGPSIRELSYSPQAFLIDRPESSPFRFMDRLRGPCGWTIRAVVRTFTLARPSRVSDEDVRRVATVLIYLDPAEAGGETIFPKHRRCQDHKLRCNRHLHRNMSERKTFKQELVVGEGKGFFVKGQKGQAIVFYSHNLDGQHNPLSTHASCPVERGEKWVAQQWFRVQTTAEKIWEEQRDIPYPL
eukprot:g21550.t1